MNGFVTDYIGTISSPFTTLSDMPIQPVGAKDAEGVVHVKETLAEGLTDLAGFSHIYLLYHFHAATRAELSVIPFMDTEKRGVFATRSPLRPSHIGLSIVEVMGVEGAAVRVRGIDVLDGTPLLDIKPYIPQFDHRDPVQTGWMAADRKAVCDARSDERFL